MAKIISTYVAAGRQSVSYQQVLQAGTSTLRVDIVSDSYKFQCSARVSRWDGVQWHVVHFLHHDTMKTREGLVYIQGASERDFAADRAELLRVALAILGG
jgi:hypothetical protein